MRLFGKADSGLGRRMVLVAGAAAVVLPLAAVAADATTPASATVSACSTKPTGALRLIHPGLSGLRGHCASTETPVSWNQVGPQGVQGLPGQQGEKGDQGIQGIQGIQGAQGDPGTPGVSGFQRATSVSAATPPGGRAVAAVACPEGQTAIGGGFDGTGSWRFEASEPSPNAGQQSVWFVTGVNIDPLASHAFTLFALCANVS